MDSYGADIASLGDLYLNFLNIDIREPMDTKTSFKKYVHAASNFIVFVPSHSVIFANSGKFLWTWILKECIKLQKKKKNIAVLCSCPPQVKNGKFLIVVVQRQQRNVQKSMMHLQSYCFANLNLLLFCRSHCGRHWRDTKGPYSRSGHILRDQ